MYTYRLDFEGLFQPEHFYDSMFTSTRHTQPLRVPAALAGAGTAHDRPFPCLPPPTRGAERRAAPQPAVHAGRCSSLPALLFRCGPPKDYNTQQASAALPPARRALSVSDYDPQSAPRRGGEDREGEPGPRGSGPAGRGCAERGFLSVWWRRPFCAGSSLSRSGCGVGTWRGGETERGQPGPSASPSLRLPARRSPPLRRCPRPRAELTHHYGRRRAAPDPVSGEGAGGDRGAGQGDAGPGRGGGEVRAASGGAGGRRVREGRRAGAVRGGREGSKEGGKEGGRLRRAGGL